jgi:hypothetical protein
MDSNGGNHVHHAHSRATARHTKVNDTISSFYRKQYSSRDCPYSARVETSMETLGFYTKEDAVSKVNARVDLYLQDVSTGHIFFTDVTVRQPEFKYGRNRLSLGNGGRQVEGDNVVLAKDVKEKTAKSSTTMI